MELVNHFQKQMFSAAGYRQHGSIGQNDTATVLLFIPKEMVQIDQVLMMDPVKTSWKQPALQVLKRTTKHGFAPITIMCPGIIAV